MKRVVIAAAFVCLVPAAMRAQQNNARAEAIAAAKQHRAQAQQQSRLAIAADSKLAALDQKVRQAYQGLLAQADSGNRQVITASQNTWRAITLDVCGDPQDLLADGRRTPAICLTNNLN